MATAVIMPKAGITVESCIIGKWEKQVGDQVKKGEILFSYETDKAAFQCESTAAGELLEIFYQEGDEVPCLENVCVIGTKGENFADLKPSSRTETMSDVLLKEEYSNPSFYIEEASISNSQENHFGISPRAKRLASRSGVDVAQAVPSGPKNRIIERDVRKLMTKPTSCLSIPETEIITIERSEEYTDSHMPVIRKTIARSMMNSLHGTAQLTHNFSFDATEIKNYRAKMKEMGGDYAGVTIGDMVLYAVSRTLLSYPDLNAHMLDDNTIRHYHTVHLAVAVDTPRGLLVPVIHNAEKKSLLELSREMKSNAKEAVSGAISPDKLTGGTFTVSNLGSFDVESFTPIINPPQTGIIGVCKIIDRPRSGKNGTIELYPAMTLSLTYDHRAIDGAPASRFMQEICRKLENFTAMLAD